MSGEECLYKGIIVILFIVLLYNMFNSKIKHKNKHNSYDNCQTEQLTDNKQTSKKETTCGKKIGTPGYEPIIVEDKGNYSGDTVQRMSLESDIYKSQNDYINGLGFAGLPTGSSHETILEETGRSYGTANFVGLTARKFCKARQLATPASDARSVPSETVKEWCNIDMTEMI